MALTGDKIGIPEAEEAPLVMMPRWKQPIAGIIALIWTFLVSIAVWYVIGFSPFSAAISLFGGFGLMAVLFAIWFENWPFYKLKTPWKVGLAATILNVVVALVFFFVANAFAEAYASSLGIVDPFVRLGVGWAIFGSLSGACFSFAVLWVAGTMYWPVFDKKQPVRGAIVFIIGWIITLVTWLFLFFPFGNPAAVLADPLSWVLPAYGINMAWTQWTIFFSLLTLMAFEYWPWNKAGKQPLIGIVAFIVCIVLGYLWVIVAGYVGFFITVPMFFAFGFPDPGLTQQAVAVGLWNVAYADWLIMAVIAVSLFMDNWPKGYSQSKNFLIRLIFIVVLGTIFFIASYYIAPILSILYVGNPFFDNLTPFLLVLLWVQLVFAYLWRKWPLNKPMQ
ncbi:MAG: hypothetical protein ACFFED_05325 [Candidatus Thorarchaeota archaeon]